MRGVAGAYVDARTAWVTLLILTPLDVLVVGLHLARVAAKRGAAHPLFTNALFGMHREFSLGECFEYGKTLVCALGLAALALRTRRPIFWLFSALFAWLTVDNAFALHEQFGRAFAARIKPEATLGFREARHLGEVVAFALVGAVLLLSAYAFVLKTPRFLLPTVAILGGAVLCLPVFGVGIDALHASWAGLAFDDTSITLLEDGGELLGLSLNCAVVLGCLFYRGWPEAAPTARPVSGREPIAIDT
jgi:hypothetical protein